MSNGQNSGEDANRPRPDVAPIRRGGERDLRDELYQNDREDKQRLEGLASQDQGSVEPEPTTTSEPSEPPTTSTISDVIIDSYELGKLEGQRARFNDLHGDENRDGDPADDLVQGSAGSTPSTTSADQSTETTAPQNENPPSDQGQ